MGVFHDQVSLVASQHVASAACAKMSTLIYEQMVQRGHPVSHVCTHTSPKPRLPKNIKRIIGHANPQSTEKLNEASAESVVNVIRLLNGTQGRTSILFAVTIVSKSLNNFSRKATSRSNLIDRHQIISVATYDQIHTQMLREDAQLSEVTKTTSANFEITDPTIHVVIASLYA